MSTDTDTSTHPPTNDPNSGGQNSDQAAADQNEQPADTSSSDPGSPRSSSTISSADDTAPSSLSATLGMAGSGASAAVPYVASTAGMGALAITTGLVVGGGTAAYGAVKAKQSTRSRKGRNAVAGQKSNHAGIGGANRKGASPLGGSGSRGARSGAGSGKTATAGSLGLGRKHPGESHRGGGSASTRGKSAAGKPIGGTTRGTGRAGASSGGTKNPLGAKPTSGGASSNRPGPLGRLLGGKNGKPTSGGNSRNPGSRSGANSGSSKKGPLGRLAGALTGSNRRGSTPGGNSRNTGSNGRSSQSRGRLRRAGSALGRGASTLGKGARAAATHRGTRATGRGLAAITGLRKGGYSRRAGNWLGGKVRSNTGKLGRKIAGWLKRKKAQGSDNTLSAQMAGTLLALLAKQQQTGQPAADSTTKSTPTITIVAGSGNADGSSGGSKGNADTGSETEQGNQTDDTDTGGAINPDGEDTATPANTSSNGAKMGYFDQSADALSADFAKINPEGVENWNEIKQEMNQLAALFEHIGSQCLTPMAQRFADQKGLTAAFSETLQPLATHMRQVADTCNEAVGVVRTRQNDLVQYAEEGDGTFDANNQ